MSFIKRCTDCTFYNRGYCQRKGRNVLTAGEAVTCNYYTPIGQVAISDLSLLGGQLAEWQIPSGIITTVKIADSAIQTAKINNAAITTEKVATGAITGDKIADGTILTADLEDFIVTNQKVSATAGIVESKLALDYGTTTLHNDILTRQPSSEKDQANGYLGLDAGAKVPLSKLNALTNTEIAAGAGIVESKLSLDYGTSALNTDIQTREQSANKDQANGYLGLDAGAKVPLSKLNPLTNTEIAAGAAIEESKLNLDQSTADLLLAATYLAHDHSLADPTQVDHANLLNVLANQHHNEAHTLASHTTKAHSELTGVGTSDHHAKTANDEVFGLLNSGLDASKGAAGTAGKLYFATDTKILYRDNGTSWAEILRGETVSRLASLSEKNHANLTNVLASQHHAKTTSISELTDHNKVNHDSLNIDADTLDSKHYADISNEIDTDISTHAGLASVHHAKYTDSEARTAVVSDAVFGSGWDGVTTYAPSKNAVYDELKKRPDVPRATKYGLYNGATMSVSAGTSIINMPSADADCSFACVIRIPNDWPTTTGTIKIAYMMSVAYAGYSVGWYVASTKSGEVNTTNILNNSTIHDFPQISTANQMGIHSISITGIEAGDILGIRAVSDASNSTNCYIMDVWLE